MKETKVKKLGAIVVTMAKISAKIEANTACAFLGHQIKEPKGVKKLRKF